MVFHVHWRCRFLTNISPSLPLSFLLVGLGGGQLVLYSKDFFYALFGMIDVV
jgi:hypothetical protein